MRIFCVEMFVYFQNPLPQILINQLKLSAKRQNAILPSYLYFYMLFFCLFAFFINNNFCLNFLKFISSKSIIPQESKRSIRILLERLEPEFLRNDNLCILTNIEGNAHHLSPDCNGILLYCGWSEAEAVTQKIEWKAGKSF